MLRQKPGPVPQLRRGGKLRRPRSSRPGRHDASRAALPYLDATALRPPELDNAPLALSLRGDPTTRSGGRKRGIRTQIVPQARDSRDSEGGNMQGVIGFHVGDPHTDLIWHHAGDLGPGPITGYVILGNPDNDQSPRTAARERAPRYAPRIVQKPGANDKLGPNIHQVSLLPIVTCPGPVRGLHGGGRQRLLRHGDGRAPPRPGRGVREHRQVLGPPDRPAQDPPGTHGASCASGTRDPDRRSARPPTSPRGGRRARPRSSRTDRAFHGPDVPP